MIEDKVILVDVNDNQIGLMPKMWFQILQATVQKDKTIETGDYPQHTN